MSWVFRISPGITIPPKSLKGTNLRTSRRTWVIGVAHSGRMIFIALLELFSENPNIPFAFYMATKLCTSSSPVSFIFLITIGTVKRSLLQACGPGIEQHCDKNLYVSGICYLFDTKLHNPKNITTGYQSKKMH